MTDSVGKIGLDLVINKQGFQREVNGLKSIAAKAGKAIAAAFAIKKLVDFGKSAIQLGSDLAEVQNVVDVTFPRMSKQVDDFAKKAINSFGLSETMSKRYIGTFGSMAKAFGFSEKAAFEMSSALTGLTGDVASFYNISQDAAYTKLKSVFSGETETLKDLGIVMTQSALDSYAMANGFGKVTKEMSESEKVALRFQFVTSKLSLASGDFIRTSDGWANQVRMLKLQFESFMATVGQGLINLFLPVIKVINFLLSKLMTVGNAFKSFTELITGKKSSEGSGIGSEVVPEVDGIADGLDNASESADGLGDATDKAGKKAKKAAKEMKSLFGFDQINKLSDPSDSGDSGSGSGGGKGKGAGGGSSNGIKGADVNMGKLAEGSNKLSEFADGLLNRFKELFSLFAQGFKLSFRADGLERIQDAVFQIFNTLKEITTDENVVESFNRMLGKIAFALGQLSGSFGTIGVGLGVLLSESMANGLERQKERIKKALKKAFDNAGEFAESGGNIATDISDTFYEVMTSSGAVRIGSAIVSATLSVGSSMVEVGTDLAKDLIKGLESYVSETKVNLKIAWTGTLDGIAPVIETIEKAINNLSDTVVRIYEGSIRPVIEKVFEVLTKIANAFLESYNTYVLPVLKELGEKFTKLYDEHFKPMVKSFEEFMGKLSEMFQIALEIISPFFEWLASSVGSDLASVIETIGTGFINAIESLIDIIKTLWDTLSDVIDFVIGVFSLDWKKAWEWISKVFSEIWDLISKYAGYILDKIKAVWNSVPAFFSNLFKGAWEGIKTAWSAVVSWFKTIWENISKVFSAVGTWFGNRFSEAFSSVKKAFSGIKKFFTNIWDSVKEIFVTAGTKIGSAVGDAFKGAINAVLSTIENIVNGFIGMINGVIGLINKIPGVDLGSIGYVNLPRLAQGGFVKANTPQIAMIGDNKHYGEIVAPENKMLAMARKAAELSNSGGNSTEVVALLRALLESVRSLNLTFDGDDITKKVVDKINALTMANGESPLIQ